MKKYYTPTAEHNNKYWLCELQCSLSNESKSLIAHFMEVESTYIHFILLKIYKRKWDVSFVPPISFSSINIILTNFVNYIYLWAIKMFSAKYFIFTQLIFLKLLFFGVVCVCLFVILFCFVFFLFSIFLLGGGINIKYLKKNVNSLLKECAKSWCV